eukprot:RCo031241
MMVPGFSLFAPTFRRAVTTACRGSWRRGCAFSGSRARPRKLSKEVARLKTQLKEAREELQKLRHGHEALARRSYPTALRFSVGHYNILASYLGSNKEPWFLYGVDLSGEEGAAKRAAVLAKFYQKTQCGDMAHTGWPSYVEGILTPEEQRKVEEIDELCFQWERRKNRVLDTLIALDTDVIAAVEMDHYEDFFQPRLSELGYGSVFHKRPRFSSQ